MLELWAVNRVDVGLLVTEQLVDGLGQPSQGALSSQDGTVVALKIILCSFVNSVCYAILLKYFQIHDERLYFLSIFASHLLVGLTFGM